MRIDVVDRPEHVDRESWNRLAAAAPAASVFGRHEWMEAWCESSAPAGAPRIVTAHSADGALRGVAPLFLDAAGDLSALGDGPSDYFDLLVPSGDRETAAALWGAVGKRLEWRRAHWRYVPEGSHLDRLLAVPGSRAVRSPPIACPRLDLTDPSVAAKAAGKKSLRRHHNHFARQPGFQVLHVCGAVPADVHAHLDGLFEQHVARWAETPTPSAFRDEAPRRFLRTVVDRFEGTDVVRLTRVSVDEGPIAFHLGFSWLGTFVWYKPTFDPTLARKSPGEVLIKALLEQAIAEKQRTFDFTIGGEAFKLRFATSVPRAHTFRQFRGGLAYRRADAIERLRGALRPLKARLTGTRRR